MTFDIMGINPLNENGHYLSFNNVSWHPLWTTLCQHTAALTRDDHEKGSMNDGLRIEGSKHFAIIETLDESRDYVCIWRIPEGNCHVSQIAAPLSPFDGTPFKFAVEILRSEG